MAKTSKNAVVTISIKEHPVMFKIARFLLGLSPNWVSKKIAKNLMKKNQELNKEILELKKEIEELRMSQAQ